MKRLVALMVCAVSLGASAQSGDCSSYMTLTSTPSGCDASGSVTADVTDCSTLISGGSPVINALYEGFDSATATYCFSDNDTFMCGQMGMYLQYVLISLGVSYADLINELQALAGGAETNDCVVSWSDSTGNNVGEGFTLAGLAAGTYTASLTHSNGCTDTQTIEVLLECGGCTDESACNYNPAASQDDYSCDYSCCPGPGCCGLGTAWNWETSECDVANPSDSNFDGCVQLNDLLDLLSAYGDCGAEESPWQCGDPLEYQGYDYGTVQIGEQCWFAENLRAQNYRDELPISEVEDCTTWSGITEGAYCSYENQTDHSNVHGLLYNWFVTDDSLGVCPSGWHVPTDFEWMALEIEIGMSESEANGTFLRGTTEGDELKSATTWNGMDAHGFNSLPSGWRGPYNGCEFLSSNVSTYYWSSSSNGSLAIGRGLTSEESGIWRMTTYQLRNGFSIRCIKDAE